MKILYLPTNVASMPALTADALERLPGVEAINITVDAHKYISKGKNTIPIQCPSNTFSFKYFFYQFKKIYYFIRLILWADVVHYTWNNFLPFNLDLKIIQWLKKPGVVEWVGSDIRNPDIALKINPYLKKVFENGYEFKSLESSNRLRLNQIKFKKAGFVPACCPEMLIYVDKQLFQHSELLFQRIDVKSFSIQFPDRAKTRPLIVHSPSSQYAKGSNIILPVIEELKKDYEFDFILLHNVTRDEVLEIMRKADVFLDQIILGSYGMAAMEAMSFGKPVMCYIMDDVYNHGLPIDCPIVNTNPDNLKEQLIRLITDADLRHEIGKKSRAYVEKFHDVEKVSKSLLSMYNDIIDNRKKAKSASIAVKTIS